MRDVRMEEEVQQALGSSMPTMSNERWEGLRSEIAALVRRKVAEANDNAQIVVLETYRHATAKREARHA